jgi:hypothetical protein
MASHAAGHVAVDAPVVTNGDGHSFYREKKQGAFDASKPVATGSGFPTQCRQHQEL